MRRKDREVKAIDEILAIIDRCAVCRLALQDEEGLYLVPLNFGYEYMEDHLVLYFHSAKQGRKVSSIRKGCQAAFEMDRAHGLVEGTTACEYGYSFESVVGTGWVSEVTDPEEKKRGLQILMRHQTKQQGEEREFSFTDKMAAHVLVFKVEADQFTGKRRLAQ